RTIAIRDNVFVDSDAGVDIVRHDDFRNPMRSDVVIEDNELHALTRYGVMLVRAAHVERLDGNSFYDIAAHPAPTSPADRAAALVLDTDTEPPPAFPIIEPARGNRFSGDDVAIEVRGERVAVAGATVLADFGTAADHGHNSFRCNGTAAGAPVPGF